jgi:hypothetical protein
MPYGELLVRAHEAFEVRLRTASDSPVGGTAPLVEGDPSDTSQAPQADNPHAAFDKGLAPLSRHRPGITDALAILQAHRSYEHRSLVLRADTCPPIPLALHVDIDTSGNTGV